MLASTAGTTAAGPTQTARPRAPLKTERVSDCNTTNILEINISIISQISRGSQGSEV